jgi:hypothetical protein
MEHNQNAHDCYMGAMVSKTGRGTGIGIAISRETLKALLDGHVMSTYTDGTPLGLGRVLVVSVTVPSAKEEDICECGHLALAQAQILVDQMNPLGEEADHAPLN